MNNNGKQKPQKAKVLEAITFVNVDDDGGRHLYPNIFDLLTPRWVDGQVVRQAGRLTLKPDGSSWRVSIECPTEGLQTTLVVRSLETMMPEVEDHVTSGKAHWGLTWALQRKNLPTIEKRV